MAHIRKTESGNYEVFMDMGKDPASGKRKQITKTFNTKRDAKDWVAKKRQEKTMGIGTSLTKISVEDYFERWLEDYALPKLSPTTYSGYEMIVTKHIIPALGALRLDEVKPLHIQSYQNKKMREGRLDGKEGGLSKKTVLQHHRILNRAFKQAVLWQLISYNPVKAVPAPSPEKPEIRTLSIEEVELLLEKAEDTWLYYFIYIAVNTGMRRGELLGLSWDHIDFNGKKIQVTRTLVRTKKAGMVYKGPKNKSSRRVISIAEDDIKVLKKLRIKQNENKLLFGPEYHNNNLLFCKADGSEIYPNTTTNRFKLLAKRIGLKEVSLHDLRHTHATLMLQAGVHPKVVQERLGHSTITTTLDTYSHVIPSMQKESVDKYKKFMNS